MAVRETISVAKPTSRFYVLAVRSADPTTFEENSLKTLYFYCILWRIFFEKLAMTPQILEAGFAGAKTRRPSLECLNDQGGKVGPTGIICGNGNQAHTLPVHLWHGNIHKAETCWTQGLHGYAGAFWKCYRVASQLGEELDHPNQVLHRSTRNSLSTCPACLDPSPARTWGIPWAPENWERMICILWWIRWRITWQHGKDVFCLNMGWSYGWNHCDIHLQNAPFDLPP